MCKWIYLVLKWSQFNGVYIFPKINFWKIVNHLSIFQIFSEFRKQKQRKYARERKSNKEATYN